MSSETAENDLRHIDFNQAYAGRTVLVTGGAGAIGSNRQLRIVALLVLRLIHAWPRRALAAQNLKHVSHAAAAALATRRRSERLTDAFKKLLLPGTRMRDTSACVISNNRLL